MTDATQKNALSGLISTTDGGQFSIPNFLQGSGTRVTAQEYAKVLDERHQDPDIPISLQVQLPFCPSRCLSCDHDTSVTHDAATIDAYIDTLEREATLLASRLHGNHPLLQLHLSGGTPNYLTDTQLVRLMDIIEAHFPMNALTETSLEASPKRSSLGQLELLSGLGFKGINFEIRDVNEDVQMAMGRAQSLSMLQDAFANAREVGFKSVSMDLVYGLPTQSIRSIEQSLEDTIELNPDRIACYSYSRRADVFPHQRAMDANTMPSLGDKLAMFNIIVDRMEAADYQWVGLDCFVKRTDPLAVAQTEGRLHHNWIGYTAKPQNGSMLGLGTNAVSEINGLCVQNYGAINDWREALQGSQLPIQGGFRYTAHAQQRKAALSDLMCNMQLSDYSVLENAQHGTETLEKMQQDGLIDVAADRITLTSLGRYMLHHLWGDASPSHRWGFGG